MLGTVRGLPRALSALPTAATASRLGLALAALAAAITAAISLAWRYDFDAPLFLYAGQLMAGGEVPYRDFFEFNPPLALGIHWLIVDLFGTSDLGVRLADLAYLATLLAVTALGLRSCGRRVATAATLLYALAYLGGGPLLALQRDHLLLLPLAVASGLVLAAPAPHSQRATARALLAGGAVGLAALIKPHALIFLPAIVAALAFDPPVPAALGERRRAGSAAVAAVAGTAAVAAAAAIAGTVAMLAIAAAWLAARGALAPFLDIARHYWPLYARLSGEMEVLDALRAAEYRTLGTVGYLSASILIVPAVLGFLAAYDDLERRRTAWVLAAMAVTAAAYAAAAGKLWSYHWLPFVFFALLLVAQLALPRVDRLSSVVLLLVTAQLTAGVVPTLYFALHGELRNELKGGWVDRLAAHLAQELEPGDTVQALDITDGSLNAMLRADAPHATEFLISKYFFHPLSEAYVVELRQRFLDQLRAHPPRFVIEVPRTWNWLRGRGVDPRFRPLRDFLDRRYIVVLEERGYRLHELVESRR